MHIGQLKDKITDRVNTHFTLCYAAIGTRNVPITNKKAVGGFKKFFFLNITLEILEFYV